MAEAESFPCEYFTPHLDPAKPHHDFDATTITAALELLTKHGFDGLARPREMLFNEAMRLVRDAYLGAGPWERSEERRGYANAL